MNWASTPHSFVAQFILLEVHLSESAVIDVHPDHTAVHHSWVYRRIALPIFALLRMGATPEKLAWSIAAGLLIGINPVLGSTTVLCLAAAFVFRLNVAASQIGNHIVYPMELLLVVPFIRFGSWVFGTSAMPLSAKELLSAARTSPIALSRELWIWEWHAFVLWIAIAVLAVPLIAISLTPVLRRLLVRVQRHQYPVLSNVSQNMSGN